MKHRFIGLAAALLAAGAARAEDAPVTADEFTQVVASPFKATNAKSGLVINIHLRPNASVVASNGYNDVGTWRRDGDATYCVRWNKQRLEDRCARMVRRDGKLGLLDGTGNLAWWVEASR